MAPQLRVYVPPHPVIRHWLTIAREKHTPVPLFRTAMNEMGKWLTYEAVREFLPVQEVNVETPLGNAAGQIIDNSVPLAFVPILRAGLSMLEGCQSLLPSASVYHLGLVRNEETLEASCYLNRLPERFAPQTHIFIVEPMMATGGSIITTLKLLTERGADASQACFLCKTTRVCTLVGNFKFVKTLKLLFIFGVWAAPGARENLQKCGVLGPSHF